MDTDSFFTFDNCHPAEDEGDVEYDADYDALNDETFGSAAVDGDWEEGHQQFSSQTEAEKSHRQNKVFGSLPVSDVYSLSTLHNKDQINDSNCYDKPRLFERNVNLGELSSSPGNSIWTPTQSLLTNKQRSISDIESSLSSFCNLSVKNSSCNEANLFSGIQRNIAPPPGLPKQLSNFKTVEEIELELKRQHSLPSFIEKLNQSKPVAMTVEDLERMNFKSVQSNKNTASAQLNFHQRQSHHGNFPNSHNSGNGMPRPNHIMMPHQHNAGPNHLGFRQFGNMKRAGLPFHPILNPHGNRPGPPIGMMNNMHNGIYPPRPMMPPFNHRPMPNCMTDKANGFFPNGNQQRNMNFFNNNLGLERRNYEQNMRFEHMRSNHYERDQSCGQLNEGGNRVRRDSDAEWEEWQRLRQLDEYAGLMTPREKNWLRNIQSLQLQTDNPYQDDYYFVMHSVKHERKREDEIIELDGLQMLMLDKGKEGKEYEPPKLENSLGKLQVASVNAPRKIIDLEVVHLDASHPATLLQKDMRKHRTLLMHVEKMYDSMIELDDLQRKIRALPDCPTRDSFRSKCRHLVTKLWNDLINPHETFVQTLCIKKGKTLLARLMIWIGESEVEHLLATVIQNLSLLSKKDVIDKRLPLLWPIADRFLATRNASSIVSFGIMMGPQLKAQKNSFIPALVNKLGLSMVLSLLVRGENLWNELKEDVAWMQFITDVVTALCCRSSCDEKLEPLLSITLAGLAKLPCDHIARCTKVESSSIENATQVLKVIENYLLQNTPAGGH